MAAGRGVDRTGLGMRRGVWAERWGRCAGLSRVGGTVAWHKPARGRSGAKAVCRLIAGVEQAAGAWRPRAKALGSVDGVG